MAVASYYVAWINIHDIKNKTIDIKSTVSEFSYHKPYEVVYEMAPPEEAMSQLEVSATMNAITLIDAEKQNTHVKSWQKNAQPTSLKEGMSYIAIVIDDVGVVPDRSARSVRELPKAVTLAFLPYGEATGELSAEASKLGHEIMIHLPMEPHLSSDGYVVNPGEGALYTSYPLEDISGLVEDNLKSLLPLAVGVNNHMGSKFTEWADGLAEVFKVIENKELIFLDSITTAHSAAPKTVVDFDIPFLKRDVFLDHEIESSKILKALEKTERIAKSKGYAIAIGHPHDETTDVIKLWVNSLKNKNIQLVPITALIKENKK